MVKVLMNPKFKTHKSRYKVLEKNTRKGMYIDGYLQSNLDHVYKNVTKNDFDSFIVITGREGFGKSTIAAQIATFLDPTYNINRCCFTAEQFEEACITAGKFKAVVFDETMGYLSSRGAMSKFNRGLIKIMSEMRSKNLFCILCIPNFFELDRYPAIHRSTGLIHVYKRGAFGSYDYNTKKKLYLLGKKTYSYSVTPNFIGRYVDYFPLPKEEYESKKQVAINDWVASSSKEKKYQKQRDILIEYLHKEKKETQQKISELIGVTKQYINFLLGKLDNE